MHRVHAGSAQISSAELEQVHPVDKFGVSISEGHYIKWEAKLAKLLLEKGWRHVHPHKPGHRLLHIAALSLEVPLPAISLG